MPDKAGETLARAVAAHNCGDLAAAERLYRAALEVAPNDADALALLGKALDSNGKHAEAADNIRQAIAVDPSAALFHFYLAGVEENLGDIPRAIASLRRATELQPRYGEAWVDICRLSLAIGDLDSAAYAGRTAVELQPANAKAWFYQGLCLSRAERHEEALAAYRKAGELQPDALEIFDNIGLTLQALRRYPEAVAAFNELLRRSGQWLDDDELVRAEESRIGAWHYHLSQVELLTGDYRRGFARYRSRFNALAWRKRPPYPWPLWRGENLSGKTVLVYEEQGLGDCLMFCRYLPKLKAMGARVLISVPRPLAALLRGWAGADSVFVRGEEITEPCDFCASFFDLPYGFGTSVDEVPADTPYLPLPFPTALPDAAKADAAEEIKVGVVWAGSPSFGTDALRSVPLKVFATMFPVKGARFFSLNRDKRDGDEAILAASGVADLSPEVKDFRDVAGFVAALDLIICCDTAIAHLAGGMGKEVWVLIPYAPDWRWKPEGESAPWYPRSVIFRQKNAGDWGEVVARVASALAVAASEKIP